ncbi:TSCPD domain-containing protein [Micromonospora aurantiaca (nom. illeg.)]
MSEFVVDGIPGRLVTAAGPDGRLTHVDLAIGKHGSTLAGLTDALSTAITTGLRAGAPLAEFVNELRHTRYAPAGATGDPDVPHTTSLGDYLAQRLHHNHPDAVACS